MPRPSGPSLLVADGLRASFSRKTGELRGFRRANDRARHSGRGLTTVVMFILVPMAKMPKKLDVQKIADQWGIKHIDLMVKQYR